MGTWRTRQDRKSAHIGAVLARAPPLSEEGLSPTKPGTHNPSSGRGPKPLIARAAEGSIEDAAIGVSSRVRKGAARKRRVC
jgi:hypothetical protein